jgi:hypothetical protein
MAFLKLCRGDPIVDTLTDVFHANIIRVPEERYAPLIVLAARGDIVSFRGKLSNLIGGSAPAFPQPTNSQMTEVTGKKSRSVNVDLGLSILDGFLKGFGIPSMGVQSTFKGVKKVSYTFNSVVRKYLDVGEIGDLLVGTVVNEKNPAAAIFFGDDPYRFLVIDSIVTSSQFTIAVEDSGDAKVKFDVPAVQKLIGDAKVGVTVVSETGYDLSFSGPQQLAFAFTCQEFLLDADGRVTKLIPDSEPRILGFQVMAEIETEPVERVELVMLSNHPGMHDIQVPDFLSA